jgi:integrase
MGRNIDPWVPKQLSVWITRKRTTDWVLDRSSGQRRRRETYCWDLSGRVDGIQWQKRFKRAGLAQTWKEQLEADFAAGLAFDLGAKRFVSVPATGTGFTRTVPTVFELTELFYRQHPEWEPKTKILAAMSFNRARRWLLTPGADLNGDDLRAVEDYLENSSFLPDHLNGQQSRNQTIGRDILAANSALADSLTTVQLDSFVARFEVNQRDPRKKVSASTITRFLQPLRACWFWAVTRDDIAVDRNPWLAVRPRRKVKGKNTLSTRRAALAVDTDLVIGINQSFELATACSHHGKWGEVVECFVLIMALSGLRPGEAAGLVWEDLELPPDCETGWVTVRRTHRPVPARWLDSGEDPEWGPLKDRDLTDTRRAPIHPLLVAKLAHHRERFDVGVDGLVFHRNGKPFDADLFARRVWEPGRAALWPLRQDLPPGDPRQPKLARLRRHDLRHAACSWWLREGVDAVVCQRWSGHKTLSVFLDIYQGVAPGREDEGVQKLAKSLPRYYG